MKEGLYTWPCFTQPDSGPVNYLFFKKIYFFATIFAVLVYPLSIPESASGQQRFRPTLIVYACRVPREELKDLSWHRVTFGVVHRVGNLFLLGTLSRGSVYLSFFPIIRRARMNDRRERS